MPLYETPGLGLEDRAVLDDIARMRLELADEIRPARRWSGGLRRTSQAKAILGSNTIEGYTVSQDDALAAVDDEEPLTADERTWAEILGYRRVMTFSLTVAGTPGFTVDAQTLRAMHFMLLEHDLMKRPGHVREGAVYVQREDDGATVYEGPDADLVPALLDELSVALAEPTDVPMVQAAMAHLNLVMIHPFTDGNGRMARALQTLVLARERVADPVFASIEEWLGANTADYYRVLAATGHGRWRPEGDARLWVQFSLRAHHMQAQTLRRRVAEAAVLGGRIVELLDEHGLPERAYDPLFDAARGLRVRRPTYVKRTGIEERTATRDLKALTDAGLLAAEGQTRGRSYRAAGRLDVLRRELRSQRVPLADPYPGLRDEIAREAARTPGARV